MLTQTRNDARMVRKYEHDFHASGTGWVFALRNRLVTQSGELVRVHARVIEGRALLAVSVFDGQHIDEAEVPGEDRLLDASLCIGQASRKLFLERELDPPVPFRRGLSPALHVASADGPFKVRVVVHVRLL